MHSETASERQASPANSDTTAGAILESNGIAAGVKVRPTSRKSSKDNNAYFRDAFSVALIKSRAIAEARGRLEGLYRLQPAFLRLVERARPDLATENLLRHAYRKCSARAVRSWVRNEIAWRIFKIFSALVPVIPFLLLPFVAWRLSDHYIVGLGGRVILLIMAIAGVYIGYFAVVLIVRASGRRDTKRLARTLLISLVVLCACVALTGLAPFLSGASTENKHSSLWLVCIFTIAIAAISYPALFYGSIAAILLPGRILLLRRQERYAPIATTFEKLLEAISILERSDWSTDGNLKRQLIRLLTDSARLIARGLPRVVWLPSPTSRIIYMDRCTKAFDVIDGYALWVSLPKADTGEKLRMQLVELAAVVMLGKFDLLPEPTSQAGPSRKHRIAIIRKGVRTLIIGALPLALVGFVHLLVVHLQGMALEIAALSAIAWAAITYISALDPLMSSKVTTLKDLVSIYKDIGTPKK